MRNAAFQNRMDLATIIAFQGVLCVIIQTQCCVFIPEKSADVSSLLNHMITQVNVLSDPTSDPGTWSLSAIQIMRLSI